MTGIPVHFAVFPPADGATNFARDDALHERARQSDQELVRVYGWDRPVLSFGRNERTVDRFDPALLGAAGIDVARRQTGGRALLHLREITYAIAGPAHDDESLRSTYERISAILVRALENIGVPASTAGPAGRACLDGSPCFAAPSPGEIVADGQKLIASAQWRANGAFIQHGSLLIGNDQHMMRAGLLQGVDLPDVPEPATLLALLGRAPSLTEFAGALAAAYRSERGVEPVHESPDLLLDDAFVRSRIAHYRDSEWTWRR